MVTNYAGLWKLLIDRGINKITLREPASISAGMFEELGRNKYVLAEVFDKICVTLDCKTSEIIDFSTNSLEVTKNENG